MELLISTIIPSFCHALNGSKFLATAQWESLHFKESVLCVAPGRGKKFCQAGYFFSSEFHDA
jgi:hypothetical protein